MAAQEPLSQELQLLDLSGAAFTSPTFRSVDMDPEVHKDGGIMAMTLERLVASSSLQAFIGDDFELTLAKAGPQSARSSYGICMAPRAEVQNGFAKCLEELLRPSVSLLHGADDLTAP